MFLLASCQGVRPLISLCFGSTRSAFCDAIREYGYDGDSIKQIIRKGLDTDKLPSSVVVCQTQIDSRGMIDYGIKILEYVPGN